MIEEEMKLHTALGTGLIVVGGAAAGMYGTGCVDHALKYNAADREERYWEYELSEEQVKYRYFQLEQEQRVQRRNLCIRVLESGKPVSTSSLEYCEDNEQKYQQSEEEYKSSVPVINYYTQKLFEAELKENHHAQENITHAAYAVLSLIVAAAGYAVRKSAQNQK